MDDVLGGVEGRRVTVTATDTEIEAEIVFRTYYLIINGLECKIRTTHQNKYWHTQHKQHSDAAPAPTPGLSDDGDSSGPRRCCRSSPEYPGTQGSHGDHRVNRSQQADTRLRLTSRDS